MHPFDHARDASYIPPADRNYSHNPKPSAPTCNRAPVESDKLTDAVFNRLCQRASLLVTPEELLAVAPEIRAKMKFAVTTKRSDAHQSPEKATTFEVTLPTSPSDVISEAQAGRPGVVIPDQVAYDAYMAEFARDRDDDAIVVAHEARSICTLVAIVNNRTEVECILDPGCEIIAISEPVALRAGIAWNPLHRVSMESANAQRNLSLGIATNVPFLFAGVVVYLQAQIMRQVAYDVLLGRPFDDIVKSQVTNLPGDNQTITIHCPNTKQVITLPTFPRGEGIPDAKPKVPTQGF